MFMKSSYVIYNHKYFLYFSAMSYYLCRVHDHHTFCLYGVSIWDDCHYFDIRPIVIVITWNLLTNWSSVRCNNKLFLPHTIGVVKCTRIICVLLCSVHNFKLVLKIMKSFIFFFFYCITYNTYDNGHKLSSQVFQRGRKRISWFHEEIMCFATNDDRIMWTYKVFQVCCSDNWCMLFHSMGHGSSSF